MISRVYLLALPLALAFLLRPAPGQVAVSQSTAAFEAFATAPDFNAWASLLRKSKR